MSGAAAVAERSPRQRWHQPAAAIALVTIPVAVGIVGARYGRPPHHAWLPLFTANICVEVGFAVAALLLAREVGQSRTALLLGCAAICQMFGASQSAAHNPINFIEAVIGPEFWLFAGWALLRFPYQRVERRDERGFLWVAALWLGFGHLIANFTLDLSWYPDRWAASTWWPTLIHDRRLYNHVQVAVVSVDAVVALWYLLLVTRRLRRLSGVDRWILTPMAASVVAAAIPLLVRPPAFALDLHGVQTALTLMTSAALLLIPLAFIAVLVRQRITRSAIADLVTRLTAGSTPIDVTEALRFALRDPTLEVLFWVPETADYVDTEGQRREIDDTDGRLHVQVRAADGATLGMIVADPALEYHRQLVDAAVSASGLALENAHLQAALQAQLEAVRASRRRIAEAGVEERRRLERDLHDGVQQRLLALTLRLTNMQANGADVTAVVDRTREELHAALGELRELARGIHPTVLSQSGVGPALEDVVDRLPFPVTLRVTPQRWPPAVEAVAYYVVCEALSNVVKHARATGASVTVAQTSGTLLAITVSDDGCGGARLGTGSGIAGINDRIRALGGEIDLKSYATKGTTLTVRLPCE
jgi:signal transduction histidine kinase